MVRWRLQESCMSELTQGAVPSYSAEHDMLGQASGRCGKSLGSFLWSGDVNYVDASLADELSLSKPEDGSVTAKYFAKAHDEQDTAGIKKTHIGTGWACLCR